MIIEHLKVSTVDARMNDQRMLQALGMRNNDLVLFVHEWDECLMKRQARPDDDTLLSAFYDQVRSHASIRHDIACYNRLAPDDPGRSYEGLRKVVDAQLERDRSDKVRHDFLAPRAPAGVGAEKGKQGDKS